LDSKTEILIGIGAAVAVKCQQCLTFFITLARNNSIDGEEIKKVIKIGKRVGLSSLKNMNNFASNLLDLPSDNPNVDNTGPCGCT